MTMEWKGVMPAITTCFTEDLEIDHEFTAKHVNWLVDHGCTGIVCNGSLGEGNTLTFEEKIALWKTCVDAVGDRVPVIASIAALSTKEAVELAKAAEEVGCRGLMLLPPYVYRGDWPEMKYHVSEIFKATPLSCMLYNNPIAYGTDFTPENIAELAAEFDNFHSVKESSSDVRRISGIRALIGDRLKLFIGVDDAIVEGIGVGVTGWIAGMVCAFPAESVALFDYAMAGEKEKAKRIYDWFLPTLRLDTVPKFVQMIKLSQEMVGQGSERVRPPRLLLSGKEREDSVKVIQEAIDNHDQIADLLK